MHHWRQILLQVVKQVKLNIKSPLESGLFIFFYIQCILSMKNINFTSSYVPVLKFLHWSVAYLVILLLPLGFYMGGLNQSVKANAYLIHKSLGITVFLLMLLRIVAITYFKRPSLPLNMPAWEYVLSRFVQFCLYIFLLIMPVSGWVMSTASDKIPLYFGLFYFPFPGVAVNKAIALLMRQVHLLTAWILLLLIFFHLSGALKHYFINKDKVLQSMI